MKWSRAGSWPRIVGSKPECTYPPAQDRTSIENQIIGHRALICTSRDMNDCTWISCLTVPSILRTPWMPKVLLLTCFYRLRSKTQIQQLSRSPQLEISEAYCSVPSTERGTQDNSTSSCPVGEVSVLYSSSLSRLGVLSIHR